MAKRKPTKKKIGSRATKNPTNNRLVQGKANSAFPMFAPNNRSPFTGTTGTHY